MDVKDYEKQPPQEFTSEVASSTDAQDDTYFDTPEDRRLLRKTDLRIVPLSAFIYLLCNLDRSNIGNAKIMNKEAGHDLMTELPISLMIFFLAYGLFEVPSNILLKKLRPSRWIAFLMFAWGSVTIGLGGVQSYASLAVVRLLLGIFEAGLFPGLVYYLTFWYRPEERSLRVALILASATLAGAFGGAIAYGVSHMDYLHGLSAWRWLFILEGVPSAGLAVPILFLLPDYPETARWLTEGERERAVERLSAGGSKASSSGLTWADVRDTVFSARLWTHYVIYFGISAPFSSMSLFAPTIVSGLGYTSLNAQLFTVPPYAVAYVVQVAVAYGADKTNRRGASSLHSRGLFSAAFAFIGAIGFIVSGALPADDYKSRYGALIIACSGAFACIPPLLGWLSANARAATRTGLAPSTSATGLAVAMNISFGAPGQILGVWIYKADEVAKGYPTGHWTNAALLLMVSVMCVGLHVAYGRMNRGVEERNRGRGKEEAREALFRL
ncbi:MFS general substrate transporter [Schizophyllum commune H4-8]|uniref:MFS general substrate transporter n=1 Tax=Schizophyllum commune (strain H4-8 / FGSC 9210) TaxID=578458 RepID=UPI00215FEBFF|nr:MFS general substrate transporter [Schizophyllum commune H4-8]KAI5888568.1 MFS general substrate transporter [Schizophyllum commune H4-8]